MIVPLCALVAQGHYGEAEAAVRELLPEIERKWGQSSLETAELLDILTEAMWRGGRGTDAAALEFASRALEIRQRRLGRDHPLVADSLVEKANVLGERAENEQAERLLKRALVLYERAYGRGDPHVATVLNNLGNLYSDLGQLDRSQESLEEALELYEALCGPDCLELTGPLGNLASTLSIRGEYEAAEELLRRQLSIFEHTGGLQNPRVFGALHNLGLNLYEQGRYLEARVLMQRAVSSRGDLLGPDHPLLAQSILNLAILEANLALVDEAEADYRLGISILERSLGERHPDVGQALVNYGAFLEVRDLVSARTRFERALEIFKASYGDDHPLTAWASDSLGRLLIRAGDWEGAESHLRTALDFWERAPAPVAALRIGAIRDMGSLQLAKGQLATAREYFDEALRLELESHGPGHAHVAGVESLIGEVLLREGEHERAEELLRRSLATVERALGAATPAYAKPLALLGDLELARENWVEALGHYREASSILETVYAGPTSETAELRLKIARCLSRLGSRRPAAVAALQAEEVSRSHLRLLLTGMPEGEGLRYASSRESGLDLAFSLVVSGAEADLTAAAVDALIRSRALVLDEMADRRRGLARQKDPATEALVEALNTARRRLAYLVVRGPESADKLAGYTSLLQAARAEREVAERELAVASRALRLQEGRRQAGLEDVVSALPEDSALVGFARIRLLDLATDPSSKTSGRGGEPSYVAFVSSDRRTEPEVILLGYAPEIEDLVERCHGHILDEAESPGVGEEWSETVLRRDAILLRKRIWDPVVARLGEVGRIFIVPDAALHLVSFAALPDGESGYLIEQGPRIHYLSAERDLVSVESRREGRGLLALGSPDFDGEPLVSAAAGSAGELSSRSSARGLDSQACPSLQSLKFRALPGTDAELNRVVSLWTRRAGGDSGVTDLRGTRASEAAFRDEVEGKKIVHLATHGFFVGEHCPAAASADLELSSDPQSRAGPAENPLLRAGLAFAGANRRRTARSGEDDGVLTAEEIAALDLRGVEWAVLSACESGLGEMRAGEGVLGLRRVLHAAGARTLIVSLWRVDDDPTREWMEALYRHRLIEERSTIEAVHEASLELLRTRREDGLSTHPYYWAGFVAAGDWR